MTSIINRHHQPSTEVAWGLPVELGIRQGFCLVREVQEWDEVSESREGTGRQMREMKRSLTAINEFTVQLVLFLPVKSFSSLFLLCLSEWRTFARMGEKCLF